MISGKEADCRNGFSTEVGEVGDGSSELVKNCSGMVTGDLRLAEVSSQYLRCLDIQKNMWKGRYRFPCQKKFWKSVMSLLGLLSFLVFFFTATWRIKDKNTQKELRTVYEVLPTLNESEHGSRLLKR